MAVFVGVLAATGLTGALRRSSRADAAVQESSVVNRVTRVGGSPPTVLGLRFALEAGRGARAVPVRSAITGAMVGVAGVVAGLVFISSLDRLVTSPSRSAIPYDVGIADVTVEELEDEVLDNPLVGDLSYTTSAPLSLEGTEVDGHAVEDLRGSLDIGVQAGRLPRTPDEITLGLRIARDLDVEVGDTVTARNADGEERELAVAGVAVVPTFNGEELGTNALMTPEGLEATATAATFTGAAVVVAPGAGRRRARGAPRVAIRGRTPGDSTRGAEPRAARTTAGGRRGDRGLHRRPGAGERAGGGRPSTATRPCGDPGRWASRGEQTAVTVVVMALAIVAIGVVIGVPVGMAVGATVWRATASDAFVLSDAYFRWELLLLPVLGAVVIALVAATIPARQAAAQSSAEGLRAE